MWYVPKEDSGHFVEFTKEDVKKIIEMNNKAGEKVVINNSKLISGTLDKSVFHNITNGLIPVIFHDYGPVEIKKFLDNTQR